MVVASVGIGVAMTAAYSVAARCCPPDAHVTGFGIMTTASLIGLAFSPVLAGFVGASGLTVVFVVNVLLLVALGIAVAAGMRSSPVAVADAADRPARTVRIPKCLKRVSLPCRVTSVEIAAPMPFAASAPVLRRHTRRRASFGTPRRSPLAVPRETHQVIARRECLDATEARVPYAAREDEMSVDPRHPRHGNRE